MLIYLVALTTFSLLPVELLISEISYVAFFFTRFPANVCPCQLTLGNVNARDMLSELTAGIGLKFQGIKTGYTLSHYDGFNISKTVCMYMVLCLKQYPLKARLITSY